MLLVVDQNLQGEEVRQVKENAECPGLRVGDVIVSENVIVEIKEYLKAINEEKELR